MKVLNVIALALVIIGALNWLLVGLFEIDAVALLFGGVSSMISRIVYVLVGISGLWSFSFFGKVVKKASFLTSFLTHFLRANFPKI